MDKKTALERISGLVVFSLLIWLIVWFSKRDS